MNTFNIKKFAQKEISNESLIKITCVDETTYEDGSVWIEYNYNGKYGYEISYEYQDGDINAIMSDIKNGFIKIDGEKNINVTDLINKPDVEMNSSYLAKIINSCRQSQNEMWFVEYDDEELEEISVEKLEDEVYNSGLYDYFDFDNGDYAIAVFGGVSTKFLF